MTARQRLVPLGIIFAISVGAAAYTWVPAFEKQREELNARKQARKDLWNTRYDAPEQVQKTEERVANAGGATRIPKDAPRWAEVQEGQVAVYGKTFNWSDVPLDQYSDKGGGQDDFGKKG